MNDLHGREISQKLSVGGFEWVEDTSKFKKDFMKTTMKILMEDIFLKLISNAHENYMKLTMIYHFYQTK